jgi:hypothetical protein
MKEVLYEEGSRQVRRLVCPSCLDEAMREAGEIRPVAGQDKAVALHIGPRRRDASW